MEIGRLLFTWRQYSYRLQYRTGEFLLPETACALPTGSSTVQESFYCLLRRFLARRVARPSTPPFLKRFLPYYHSIIFLSSRKTAKQRPILPAHRIPGKCPHRDKWGGTFTPPLNIVESRGAITTLLVTCTPFPPQKLSRTQTSPSPLLPPPSL